MRKILIALLASTAVLSTGCEKILGGDWIVDWAPVNVYIEASDTDGNSIISPDMPGMTLTFKGETYTVKIGDEETSITLEDTSSIYGTTGGFAGPGGFALHGRNTTSD